MENYDILGVAGTKCLTINNNLALWHMCKPENMSGLMWT